MFLLFQQDFTYTIIYPFTFMKQYWFLKCDIIWQDTMFALNVIHLIVQGVFL